MLSLAIENMKNNIMRDIQCYHNGDYLPLLIPDNSKAFNPFNNFKFKRFRDGSIENDFTPDLSIRSPTFPHLAEPVNADCLSSALSNLAQ
jgi:hypothetical protein